MPKDGYFLLSNNQCPDKIISIKRFNIAEFHFSQCISVACIAAIKRNYSYRNKTSDASPCFSKQQFFENPALKYASLSLTKWLQYLSFASMSSFYIFRSCHLVFGLPSVLSFPVPGRYFAWSRSSYPGVDLCRVNLSTMFSAWTTIPTFLVIQWLSSLFEPPWPVTKYSAK